MGAFNFSFSPVCLPLPLLSSLWYASPTPSQPSAPPLSYVSHPSLPFPRSRLSASPLEIYTIPFYSKSSPPHVDCLLFTFLPQWYASPLTFPLEKERERERESQQGEQPASPHPPKLFQSSTITCSPTLSTCPLPEVNRLPIPLPIHVLYTAPSPHNPSASPPPHVNRLPLPLSTQVYCFFPSLCF